MRTGGGAKRARHLLLHLEHAQIAPRLIVVKGDHEVVEEGQFAQVMKVAQRMATAGVCAIGGAAVMDADASEAGQNANRVRGRTTAIGVGAIVRQSRRAGHVRPGQGAGAAG